MRLTKFSFKILIQNLLFTNIADHIDYKHNNNKYREYPEYRETDWGNQTYSVEHWPIEPTIL